MRIIVPLGLMLVPVGPAWAESAPCRGASDLIVASLPSLTHKVGLQYDWRGLRVLAICEISKPAEVARIRIAWTNRSPVLLGDAFAAISAVGAKMAGDEPKTILTAIERCVSSARQRKNDGIYQALAPNTTVSCDAFSDSVGVEVSKRRPSDGEH